MDVPAESGPLDDPDVDDQANLMEFAFGTDPRSGTGSVTALVFPQVNDETDSVFAVEILEQEGHQSGIQIDLELSRSLTNWFRPWWLRTVISSQPGDPTNSVRELFTTVLATNAPWFVRSRVQLLETGPEAARIYVATNGLDTNPGTFAQPYRSLHKAVSVVRTGDLIYVRGGFYLTNTVLNIRTNGTAANPIRLRAYPGEHPILSFSNQTFSSSNRGINLIASWWRIYGLEIAGAGDNGMNITGHNNIIELCVFRDNRDTGLQITGPGSTNLILNCDSYHNNDPTSENADGFAPKLAGLGAGNVFRGCRAWENADDGWDLYAAPHPVLMENCWAFRNRFYGPNGDGNGFKLGGVDNNAGTNIAAPHILVNCVAFLNPHHGFDQNNNSTTQTVDNCTAWANGAAAGGSGHNFNLNHGPVVTHILRNNLSINGTVSTNTISILISNSWQVVTSPAASTNDLLSVDTSWALAPRRDDGSLPESPFLRPVPNGRLVDKGADIGNSFQGPAPDLGAFETPAW